MASPLYLAACCLGNESVVVNSDTTLSRALFEEKVINIISLIFAILSLLGIVALLYPQRNVKTVAIATHNRLFQGQGLYHVTKCLIVAGILADLSVMVRSIAWTQGLFPPPSDATFGDAKHIFCIIASAFAAYFYLSIVIWHFVYAMEAYMVSQGTTSHRKVQHILGWSLPAGLCALALYLTYSPNIGKCSVKFQSDRGLVYVTMLAPIILVLVAVMILFYKAVTSVKRSIIVHFGRYSTAERQLIDNIQVKFIIITIAFTVCWIPNILNGIFINTLEDRSGDISLVFLVLQAVLNPFQVLVDAMVLYGWPPALWKQIMRQGQSTVGAINANEGQRSRSLFSRGASPLPRGRSGSQSSERDPLISFSRNNPKV